MAAPRDVKITIRAFDRTKAVFRSVARGLRTLSARVFTFTAALAAIGAAGSIALGARLATIGERVDDLAGALDTSGTRVDAWRQLLQEAGGDVNTFARITQALADSIGRATTDLDPEALRSFARFGLSFRDLKTLNTDQVLERIFDQLARAKTSEISEPLGNLIGTRTTQQLIGAAKDVQVSFGEFFQQLRDDGRLTSDSTRKSFDRISSAFARVQNRFEAVFAKQVARLEPIILGFLDKIHGSLSGLPAVIDSILSKIPDTLRTLSDILNVIRAIVGTIKEIPRVAAERGEQISRGIVNTQEGFRRLLTQNPVARAGQAVGGAARETFELGRQAGGNIRKLADSGDAQVELLSDIRDDISNISTGTVP